MDIESVRKMKKSLIILVVILVFLTGCGKENTDNVEESTINKVEENILGENEYYRVEDNTIHKYTFTYPDKETCIKLGDVEPYEILYPVKPYAVFDCEEIRDEEGNILWGEFFYEEPSEDYIFYY